MNRVEYHDEVVGYCCSINIEAVVLLGAGPMADVRCASMGGASVETTPCEQGNIKLSLLNTVHSWTCQNIV